MPPKITLTDWHVKVLLGEFCYYMTDSERERLEQVLKMVFPPGACIRAYDVESRDYICHAWVETEIVEDGMKFLVHLPDPIGWPVFEGAKVKRLVLSDCRPGQDDCQRPKFVAIPMDGTEVFLRERAVKNCPIDLKSAYPVGVEIELMIEIE